jgi:drug/metabolite transporter (DMT)-like permease
MLRGEWRTSDSLGILLALLSTIFLALYMLLTRYEQNARGIQAMVVFAQQGVILMITALAASLITAESWQPWRTLPLDYWGLFLLFILINLMSGNLLQISSLNRLGAPLFTSLMGARLIAALLLGALLLGERLTSGWQLLGALLVVIAVTSYMLRQTRHH